LHGGDLATIATGFQALSCDNRDCYGEYDDFQEAMDEDALREHIKDLVARKAETQIGLARLIGLSADKMSKTLKGTRRFTLEEADILRRYFGVKEEERSEGEVLLPVVGLVSAGAWREGFEQVTDWIPRPDKTLSRDSFIVRLEGDSMDRVAKDGELVAVDPTDLDLVAGRYYVIRNADGETTFKQYCENPARLEPCSNNADHQPIFIGRQGFIVIGRVRMALTVRKL
jgi:repressor LexA